MADRQEIEAWIVQVALGDRSAFAALYSATSAKLFGVVLRILNDQAATEDAIQEIYIKVWHNADRYQANGLSPMTWLITIARNHAIDRLRQRRATAPMEAAAVVADPAPGPEALAIATMERQRIAQCLAALDTQKAEAVTRAYMMGETYQELSTRYDVPLNTIRTWLRRSLAKLRECLSS